MDNPIDGPGHYIMRNGETIKLVRHCESTRFVQGYFLYSTQSAEPVTGHLVLPSIDFEHANDIMSKA